MVLVRSAAANRPCIHLPLTALYPLTVYAAIPSYIVLLQGPPSRRYGHMAHEETYAPRLQLTPRMTPSVTPAKLPSLIPSLILSPGRPDGRQFLS